MTNQQYINSLPTDKLAKLLVTVRFDWGEVEEWEDWLQDESDDSYWEMFWKLVPTYHHPPEYTDIKLRLSLPCGTGRGKDRKENEQ